MMTVAMTKLPKKESIEMTISGVLRKRAVEHKFKDDVYEALSRLDEIKTGVIFSTHLAKYQVLWYEETRLGAKLEIRRIAEMH